MEVETTVLELQFECLVAGSTRRVSVIGLDEESTRYNYY